MKRHKKTSAARAARRKGRRRGGVQSIILAPNDGAVVFRASGRVKFYQSRAEPRPNTGAFWQHIIQWLFADTEDAKERRQVLQDDFLLDLQEHQIAARKAQIEETAKEKALAEIATMDEEPEMTDERVEELMTELVPKYVASIEEELALMEEEARKVQAEAAAAREAELAAEVTPTKEEVADAPV